jgi:hypothetical protein
MGESLNRNLVICLSDAVMDSTHEDTNNGNAHFSCHEPSPVAAEQFVESEFILENVLDRMGLFDGVSYYLK